MIIVDGHNVMHLKEMAAVIPAGEDHFRPFLNMVNQYADATGQKIIVAMDLRGELKIGSGHPQVKIALMQRRHHSADDVIKELLRKMGGGKANIVVTNDIEIKKRANARGWGTMSSEEFANRLLRIPAEGEQIKKEPADKTDPRMSESDIDEWEQFFKGPRPKLK